MNELFVHGELYIKGVGFCELNPCSILINECLETGGFYQLPYRPCDTGFLAYEYGCIVRIARVINFIGKDKKVYHTEPVKYYEGIDYLKEFLASNSIAAIDAFNRSEEKRKCDHDCKEPVKELNWYQKVYYGIIRGDKC